MMKLKQLSNAIALMRHGNFLRAAKAVNMSQPAFSRSIRSLEDSLEVTLFDRLKGNVQPTTYGEALLSQAEIILQEADELERKMMLLKGLDAGKLSVAMGVYPAEISASRAAGKLIEQHPKLRCRIRLVSWRDATSLVLSRSVDLGVAEISHLKDVQTLDVEPIGEHEVVLFCRHGHPLLKHEKVTKSDLDHCQLAVVRGPPRMASVLPGMGEIDPLSGDFLPSIEVDDLTSARDIVLHSDAFSIITPLQLEPWLRSGEAKILPFREPWMKLAYGFIHLRNRMLSPAVSAYMRLVREIETEQARRNRKLMDQWFPK